MIYILIDIDNYLFLISNKRLFYKQIKDGTFKSISSSRDK
ncbi:hypothetical protein PROPEN_01340 [Proteus penneri ATCC 35198]|nr:hypothetical protein PROPEN_01340 [Proteus penneri ATCC 35198]